METKPCRVCKKVNPKYPPSRLLKRDWICTKCANVDRNKWLAKDRLKKRKYANFEKTADAIATLEAHLEFIGIMDNTPTCPFCNIKMRATRGYLDRGERIAWECAPCNDIVMTRGF